MKLMCRKRPQQMLKNFCDVFPHWLKHEWLGPQKSV
jgi:hypothetical protein